MVTRPYRSLREYLKRTHTPQAAFAERVGVDRSYISMLVGGRRRPSLAIALRIAALADIPIESLLTSRRAA